MSNEMRSLPEKGVLFLGGHQNMTKKLRKHFPMAYEPRSLQELLDVFPIPEGGEIK